MLHLGSGDSCKGPISILSKIESPTKYVTHCCISVSGPQPLIKALKCPLFSCNGCLTADCSNGVLGWYYLQSTKVFIQCFTHRLLRSEDLK